LQNSAITGDEKMSSKGIPFLGSINLDYPWYVKEGAGIQEAFVYPDLDILAIAMHDCVHIYKISEARKLETVKVPFKAKPTPSRRLSTFSVGDNKLAIFNSRGELVIMDVATCTFVAKASIVDYAENPGTQIDSKVFQSSKFPDTVIFLNQIDRSPPHSSSSNRMRYDRQLIYFDMKELRVKDIVDIGQYPGGYWSPWLPKLLKGRYLLLQTSDYYDDNVMICDCLSGEIVGEMPFKRRKSAVNYDPKRDSLYVAYGQCFMKLVGSKREDSLKYDLVCSFAIPFDYGIRNIIIGYPGSYLLLCEVGNDLISHSFLCFIDTDKFKVIGENPYTCFGYSRGRIISDVYSDHVDELCVVASHPDPDPGILSIAMIVDVGTYKANLCY
jgi:hypothetical protein